jgi:hypothetical protein
LIFIEFYKFYCFFYFWGFVGGRGGEGGWVGGPPLHVEMVTTLGRLDTLGRLFK